VLLRLFYTGASAVSVYFSVARLSDNRFAAVATVIVLLTDTYVLTAVGNDYVNGPAFAFLCVGAAFLVAASRSAGSRRWLLLAFAGAALATSVAAHILSLMPAAFLCLFLLLLCKDQLGLARLLRFALTMIVGAAVALAGFGLASLALGGKFLFFPATVHGRSFGRRDLDAAEPPCQRRLCAGLVLELASTRSPASTILSAESLKSRTVTRSWRCPSSAARRRWRRMRSMRRVSP
jgi:4-amino-4-deoxy-L-arabinose transferase-like glycosyltransferase